MKKIIVAIISIFVALSASAAQPDEATKQQLTQLASEISAFTVGTKDKTFSSCTYTDGKITFVINPNSNIGKYRIANPFEENFYETLLAKMFSANPSQGIMVMEFLKATAPQICFIIPDNSETTVYVGNVIPLLQKIENDK